MRVLYLIFVICVGALLWVAIAAARHIRRHESKASGADKPADPPLTGELPDDREILVPVDKARGE